MHKSCSQGLGAGLLLLTTIAANAATITVTTIQDENELSTPNGLCSLREAITAANNDTVVDSCTAGQGAASFTRLAGSSGMKPSSVTSTMPATAMAPRRGSSQRFIGARPAAS